MTNILKEIEGFKKPVKCCGSSSSSGLPSIGEQKGVLITDGTVNRWVSPHMDKYSKDFLSDGVTCPIPDYKGQDISIYYYDGNQWLRREDNEWTPYSEGGFIITIPGFSADKLLIVV